MALDSKTGTFDTPAATGSFGVTGVGFLPKLVIIWGAPQGTGTSVNDVTWSFGAAVSSSERFCCAMAEDFGDTTMDNARWVSESLVLRIINPTTNTAATVEADFTSMDSDGFTLNFTIASATAHRFNYLALGGSDISNVKLKRFDLPTSTGNVGETGVGFQPDLLLVAGGGINSAAFSFANAIFFLGFADGTNQGCIATSSVDAVGTSVTNKYQHQSSVYVTVLNDALTRRGTLTSFDTDGFTINHNTVEATVRWAWAICLKGTFQKKVGFETFKTSTGTKATTGLGFIPECVLQMHHNSTTTGSVVANGTFQLGACAPTTSDQGFSAAVLPDAAATSTAKMRRGASEFIRQWNAAGTTDSAVAAMSSLDTDGFTIDYTTASGEAIPFIYLALGDGPATANRNYIPAFLRARARKRGLYRR